MKNIPDEVFFRLVRLQEEIDAGRGEAIINQVNWMKKIYGITDDDLRVNKIGQDSSNNDNHDNSTNDTKNFEDRVSELDKLFEAVGEYDNINKYKKRLEIIVKNQFSRFTNYNATLISFQCPNPTYLSTYEEWRKRFAHRIKPEARPIIYLNFKPVGFLYELSDTYFDKSLITDETLSYFRYSSTNDDYFQWLNDIENHFNTNGNILPVVYIQFINNLKYCGIWFDDTMRAGVDYVAKIQRVENNGKMLKLFLKRLYFSIELESNYNLHLNKSSEGREAECFGAICYELGHLFCEHLETRSSLSEIIKELEVESVVYLVCKRNGVQMPSARYLDGYLPNNERIPKINFGKIANAADEIEKLFRLQHAEVLSNNYKTWWWYRREPRIRTEIDRIIERYKKHL